MHRMNSTRSVLRQCVVLASAILAGAAAVRATDESIQARFASPEKALAALHEAVQTGDTNAMLRVFGPTWNQIANPDPVELAHQFRTLAKHLDEYTELATQANQTVTLRLGDKHWPFPIPLVMTNGDWSFDTPSGKEEILNRRIGHNELRALEVCHAYVQAQRDYASKDRAGDGVMEYAQHVRSKPGTKNGLYWETAAGEEPSPFGPLVASAQDEGYYQLEPRKPGEPKRCTPFHGYVFRILKKQGKHAPGGKYDYVINDHMVAGFALLAYPVEWGNSGVMTFVVNQQGKVYQKNLGERTATLAARLDAYDPDDTWQPAE